MECKNEYHIVSALPKDSSADILSLSSMSQPPSPPLNESISKDLQLSPNILPDFNRNFLLPNNYPMFAVLYNNWLKMNQRQDLAFNPHRENISPQHLGFHKNAPQLIHPFPFHIYANSSNGRYLQNEKRQK